MTLNCIKKIKEQVMKNKKIGWIGTGVMGQSMCHNLLDKGYELLVYNRTKIKAEGLIKRGAVWCDTPKSIAQQVSCIATMVGFPKDVDEVYFGKEGIFQGAQKESIFIDFTTTRPSLAEKIYNESKKNSSTSLDAPVSGGDVGAKNATLSIMVGGDRDIFNSCLPLFASVGKNIVYQGAAGSGQHTKMTNQIVIASTMIGVCEALLYGQKAGLDLNTVLESIAGGAAGCWTLDNLAPRIMKEDFTPGFYVEHFLKDLEIALLESKRMNLKLPGLELAYSLYEELSEKGGGQLGTQALIQVL